MHYFKIFLGLLISACIVACSSGPEPVTLQTVKEGKPSLWKVTNTDPELSGSAYLFGTIHILPNNVKWKSLELEKAISKSDRLIIEVLGLDDKQNAAKIFAKLAFSDDQDDIELRVMPSLRDDLELAIDKANISDSLLNGMETWAAALSLASAQTKDLGLQSGLGVEKKLTAQYRKMKKPIESLETIEQQLSYFDTLPEAQQRQMLTIIVEESGDTKQAFEELFNAWITGDIAKLTELTDEGILKDPKIRENLLLARNRDWAEQLDKKLTKPGVSMVAVGAGHLIGPDALQVMLEKRGYKIEKIQ